MSKKLPAIARDTLEYSAEHSTLYASKRVDVVNQKTGEVFENATQITKVIYGKENFIKVMLADFLMLLGAFNSTIVDVFVYIVENADMKGKNIFIGTQRKIAQETGVSLPMVNKAMQKFIELGFLVKLQAGVFAISPQIMYKGYPSKATIITHYIENVQEKSDIKKVEEDAKNNYEKLVKQIEKGEDKSTQ